MSWIVISTQEFSDWLRIQDEKIRVKIIGSLRLIETVGPSLGRPHSDTIKGSKIMNLKELRVQAGGSPYRLFYAFDPIRRAIVLCGGDKTGDKRFYDRMVPLAEAAFAAHLKTIKKPKPGESP